MDIKRYCSIDEFVKQIANVDEDSDLYVIGKYDIIKKLLEKLISNGVKILDGIDIESPEVFGYDKEFYLYLTHYGVDVGKAYYYATDEDECEDGYLYLYSDIAFILEDCSSKIIDYVDADKVYELRIGNEDDLSSYNCDECKEYEGVDTAGNKFHLTVKGDLTADDLKMLARIQRESGRLNNLFSRDCFSLWF